MGPVRDLIALYRATGHRRPLLNGYSGYFAPHYGALQELVGRHHPQVLGHIASFGELEIVVNHVDDPKGEWRGYVAQQAGVQLVQTGADYTVYRLPRSNDRLHMPQFSGTALPVAGIQATHSEDRTGRMTDGDLISRWDTAGPQDPTNVVTVDLGGARRVQGVELQIGGYLADFPRALTVDVSADGVAWSEAWAGETALMTYVAALEAPHTVPLRIPLGDRALRYIRMRQTGADRVYYWSIAELGVYGS